MYLLNSIAILLCAFQTMPKQRIADLKKEFGIQALVCMHEMWLLVETTLGSHMYTIHPPRERRTKNYDGERERLWKRLSNIQNVASQKNCFSKV